MASASCMLCLFPGSCTLHLPFCVSAVGSFHTAQTKRPRQLHLQAGGSGAEGVCAVPWSLIHLRKILSQPGRMTTANVILWPQANGLASLGICLVTSRPSTKGTPIETSDLLKDCLALGSHWQSCGPDEQAYCVTVDLFPQLPVLEMGT